jgi:4-amino-4-deoxy-L-arabinose transferase-like glycosyltransferase
MLVREGRSNTRDIARFGMVLFAVAFLVRLAAVIWLRDMSVGPTVPSTNDDYEFNVFAQNLAAGRGYVNDQGHPSSFRAPGFSFFLAGLYAIAGTNYAFAFLALCTLGAASCVLTYLLAREFVEERWARLAGLLSAVYLPHIYFATVFLSESLFIPLFTLGVWLFVRWLNGGSRWTLVSSGVVLGLATLTRPFALILLPLLGALMLLLPRPWANRLTNLAVWAACFLVVLAPWTARNYRVHGQFVLVATNGGSTFYGGNNDRVVTERRYYGYWLSTVELPHRDLVEAQPNEVAHDDMEWKLGKDWVKENPGQFAFAAALKLARLAVGLPDFDGGKPLYRVLRMAGYWPFLMLFLLGAVAVVRQRLWSLPWLAIHLCVVATLITAVIFWGSARFRDVNVGILMLYATAGSKWIFRRGGREVPGGSHQLVHR